MDEDKSIPEEVHETAKGLNKASLMETKTRRVVDKPVSYTHLTLPTIYSV